MANPASAIALAAPEGPRWLPRLWMRSGRPDEWRWDRFKEAAPEPGPRRRPQLVFPHPLPADAAFRPEQRLMIALLEDAARTVLRGAHPYDRPAMRLVAQTRDWFAADDPDWPFSFVNVCDALRLDASRLRRWLADATA